MTAVADATGLPLTDRPELGEVAIDPSLIRDEARRAFGWSLLNSVGTRLLTMIVGLVLARLLAPDEYGVFAVALVVLTVLQSMNELGVSVAVVQWKGDVRRASRTATTVALGTSGVLYIAAFASAPTIAEAIGSPDAAGLIRFIGVGVLVDGVSSIPGALMARAFQQRRRAIADLVALVPSSSVSIALASSGHGAVSLAWGSLVGSVSATILVLVLAPARPRPGWRTDDARLLLRTGLPLAGTSLILLATLNLDYLVVGSVLDTAALGYYLIAFNLSNWPSNLLSVAVRRVAIPGFARLAGQPAELEASFLASVRTTAAIGLTLVIPLATLAEPIVAVVYGARWTPAASALVMLAMLGGLRVVLDLAYDLLAAVGRTRSLLGVQVVWFVALLVALPIGASRGGIAGVGMAHLVVGLGVAAPLYGAAVRGAGISVARTIVALAPVVGSAAGSAVVMRMAVRSSDGSAVGLVLTAVIGFVAYALLLFALPGTRGTTVAVGRWVADRPARLLRSRPCERSSEYRSSGFDNEVAHEHVG